MQRELIDTDADPHTWADQTLQNVVSLVGRDSRIVAPEMGDLAPIDPNWKAERALESLVFLASQTRPGRRFVLALGQL